MEFIKNNAKKLGLAGCAIMIVGCFLPFMKVTLFGFSDSTSLVGVGLLGVIVLIAAVVSAVLMFTKKAKLSLISTGIAALLLVLNIANASDLGSLVTYGVGLYVEIIGMVIAAVMPFMIKKEN